MTTRLPPALVARLARLHLSARRLADAVHGGAHATRRLGTSSDFAEHREYHPGDDPRMLDARVRARTDRDVVRRFHHESELQALFALDTSASMDFASERAPSTKLAHGRTLLLGLAYVLSNQHDRIGAVDLHDPTASAPPRVGFDALEAVGDLGTRAAKAQTVSLGPALDQLVSMLRRRSLVVVASDFLDPDGQALEALSRLRARGHSVLAIHVVDPLEQDLDLDGAYEFTDPESDGRVVADVETVRDAYLAAFEAHARGLRAAADAAGVTCRTCRTDEDPGDQLERLVAEAQP